MTNILELEVNENKCTHYENKLSIKVINIKIKMPI